MKPMIVITAHYFALDAFFSLRWNPLNRHEAQHGPFNCCHTGVFYRNNRQEIAERDRNEKEKETKQNCNGVVN